MNNFDAYSFEGAMMAIEYINNNPEILADYELTLLIQDTQCKVDVAMTQFLQYAINKTHPIAGILGESRSTSLNIQYLDVHATYYVRGRFQLQESWDWILILSLTRMSK